SKLAQDFVGQFGIRQAAPCIEFGARHARVIGRQVQAAVRRQAAQQDVGEGFGIACCGRAGCAGGHIMHTVEASGWLALEEYYSPAAGIMSFTEYYLAWKCRVRTPGSKYRQKNRTLTPLSS